MDQNKISKKIRLYGAGGHSQVIRDTLEENNIVVRVYDGFRNGGIYDGSVGLITQSNYNKYFRKK